MVVMVIGQVLFLAGVVIAASLLSRLTRLDMTLSCVACGFVAGQAVGWLGFDTGIRFHNLEDIVFYVILPVLIFEASWHLQPAQLKRWLPAILLLATLGVVVSCAVTAVLLFFSIGHPTGFPWAAALLAGAILAATDPVSVIQQLSAQKAPDDLTTLFEGESLFNDATAVVLYTLFLTVAQGGAETGAGEFLGQFALVFLGGILVGSVAGLVSAALAMTLRNPAATTFLQLVTAFGSFYLAEHLLHVSGIMAVMFAALVLRGRLAGMEREVAAGTGFTWEWLGQSFTSLLFVLMGLVITTRMFGEMWLAMLLAIAAALVARAVAVGVCGLLTRPLSHNIPLGWQLLLFWGGLRGAIAVALVLALPMELDYWYTVQSMVFGVVLFSTLVQGTTNGYLVARYAGSTSRENQ